MPGKYPLGVAIVVASLLFAGCSPAPESPPAADSEAEAPKTEEAAAAPEEIKVYDLVKEDITKIPDLTSRNLSVMGVKLGDRTAEVNQNKQLGRSLATTPVGGLYRSAYQERGIYLDIDKQSGKVVTIYVNTTLARKVKGRFRSILRRGNLDLFKKMFGPEPRRLRPDLQTTSWRYPRKGVELIQTRSGEQRTYTFKLVRPRRG
ncbi:MAG: hypothetical protein OXG96_17615 [Acidobacteria bacterium]|nr:hypothetical protein [Acidobacteriota bacterium]